MHDNFDTECPDAMNLLVQAAAHAADCPRALLVGGSPGTLHLSLHQLSLLIELDQREVTIQAPITRC